MKTHSAKPQDVTRVWHIIDARDRSIGRVSVAAAQLLMGKNKSDFTPHVDGGDFVIITNASALKITGDKLNSKMYYRHSGYPSGLTTTSLSQLLGSHPSKVITTAVKGMLPANKLRADRLKRLKVYADDQHTHQAQNPIIFHLGNQESK
ncbi:50S ribosomal protein L13 [Candidatus Saccharibacteria bacterium RIFCSPLOWO2_01_FULL_48_13]|nr:MAG: 50S ribosomal protein L13 [Candidatus Saccharibacteria bacterium RIFCSPHIGHO2_01_FULL_48_12]OGL35316.1 MAG: 50S ribosomal protein L13 [Candidatus Saccharibacteria bacterium RIFCSPHIGHO2_12_FULL_48_21]OGL37551.1 MAG: 50S ribosomal protein L13 [Candidatus Saccharibacteria bacterium RIFCSPLOWO2_01_FULL_48_13]